MIRVTAVDLDNPFDKGVQELGPGEYCITVTPPLYLDTTQRYRNGTVVLTLKRDKELTERTGE